LGGYTRKGDSMATTAPGGGADRSVADELRRLGVKGVLVQMAERGQLLAVKCEMPQCYHHKGRGEFDQVTTPRTKWAPSPDHYPILKSAGGHLRPENVRLAHIYCNKRDYGWRTQIGTLLAKGKSLAEIAEVLNRKGVLPAHGTNRWTAAMVRKPTCPRPAVENTAISREGRLQQSLFGGCPAERPIGVKDLSSVDLVER
jgi:hypothetical protein